jgi:hypothetical protein
MKASEGIARIDASVARGKAAIDSAVSMFQGTVPPPPWPSPDLYKALDDVNDVRDRLDVFVRHGDPDFNAKTPQVARVIAEVNKRIDAVDAATLALNERRDLVSQRTVTNAVATVKKAATSRKWIGLAAVGYLLWKSETKGPRRR